MPSSSASSLTSTMTSPKSEFKTCLTTVPVPKKLLEGVSVTKVNTNGKTKDAFLTLSEDKFTVYITSNKLKNGKGGVPLFRPILRKVTSIGTETDDIEGNERAIDIGSIDRIQRGQNTLKFELARKASTRSSNPSSPRSRGGTNPPLELSRSFSIIFRGERTLDLMTNSDVDVEEMLDALDLLILAYEEEKVKVGNDVLLLRYIWQDVDKDKSNTINSTELGTVLDRINFYMKKSQLDATYEKFTKTIGMDRKDRQKGLSFEQCVTFLHKIKRDTWQVKPVHQVFFDLFGEFMNNGKQRTKVSADSFLKKFLWAKQGEKDQTIDDVMRLFVRLNQMEMANVASKPLIDQEEAAKFIDKDRFEAYIIGSGNDLFDPRRERFNSCSMNRPLSEYWINSSHNTYLTGHQLSSRSSVEMYMNALYRGCRCVELDCWDGDKDPIDLSPIPIVYHGHTMTTKIPFKDVIQSIRVFLNFNPHSYPIILSLENHCSIPYQEVMADDMITILQDLLYVPDEITLDFNLPSPDDLRGMVVLKGRRPRTGNLDFDQEYDSDSDDESEADSQIPARNDEYALMSPRYSQKQSVSIAPELASLTLFHGVGYKSFEMSMTSPTYHMHSFGESKVRSLCKQQKTSVWKKYNQLHMTRTFPSGKRVDSSNYSPILAWSSGCQMVALNFQTADAPLRLNDGRFRENGGCGYILKPYSLMAEEGDVLPTPVTLSVKILSGFCLPKPKGHKKGECIDPYVKVCVFDTHVSDGKETCTSYTTGHVNCNGFFPIWNQDSFRFDVENSDVAILQLTVYDRDVAKTDDFIASASTPISCLRQGYRSVRLFDANNTRSGAFDFASLLVEVKLRKARDEI